MDLSLHRRKGPCTLNWKNGTSALELCRQVQYSDDIDDDGSDNIHIYVRYGRIGIASIALILIYLMIRKLECIHAVVVFIAMMLATVQPVASGILLIVMLIMRRSFSLATVADVPCIATVRGKRGVGLGVPKYDTSRPSYHGLSSPSIPSIVGTCPTNLSQVPLQYAGSHRSRPLRVGSANLERRSPAMWWRCCGCCCCYLKDEEESGEDDSVVNKRRLIVIVIIIAFVPSQHRTTSC